MVHLWIQLNMGIGCIEKWVNGYTKEWVQGYIKWVRDIQKKQGPWKHRMGVRIHLKM